MTKKNDNNNIRGEPRVYSDEEKDNKNSTTTTSRTSLVNNNPTRTRTTSTTGDDGNLEVQNVSSSTRTTATADRNRREHGHDTSLLASTGTCGAGINGCSRRPTTATVRGLHSPAPPAATEAVATALLPCSLVSLSGSTGALAMDCRIVGSSCVAPTTSFLSSSSCSALFPTPASLALGENATLSDILEDSLTILGNGLDEDDDGSTPDVQGRELSNNHDECSPRNATTSNVPSLAGLQPVLASPRDRGNVHRRTRQSIKRRPTRTKRNHHIGGGGGGGTAQ